ncbi:MAG TPA: DUF1501 domain-containing protein, partial [Gemmataceae bacterium]|nr:DUF1501 domain-containing protein [Gemmataceae bacterium]
MAANRAALLDDSVLDRRGFFSWVQNGLGGAALSSLLLRENTIRASETNQLLPHFAPRAKRAIHICCLGAMSQVDTFDYKPGLITGHGKTLPFRERPDVFFGQVGLLRKPDWEFRQRGQSGLWVSELFPHISQVADELT